MTAQCKHFSVSKYGRTRWCEQPATFALHGFQFDGVGYAPVATTVCAEHLAVEAVDTPYWRTASILTLVAP